MASYINKSLQLSALCIAMACVHTHALAVENLEQLDDESLAESTGEGIALLPENFSIRMNGADTANSGVGNYDTGYIRLIPVGPLQGKNAAGTADITYTTSTGDVYDANGKVIRKADVYLYGLGISQSNKDLGVARDSSDWAMGFGRAINSWGTGANPWIFKTVTDSVYQFSQYSTGTTAKTADQQKVTYLSLEAPFYKTLTKSTANASVNVFDGTAYANDFNNVSGLSGNEKSAYNLRLGLWADAFMRDANVAEGTTTTTAYNGLSNQLRLNMVWDGFSVNGSNLKFFQTQNGVTGVNSTAQQGLSQAYNNTFGMAATLRLNSMPTHATRATVTMGTPTNYWQSYNASSIEYQPHAFNDTDLAALKAGTHAKSNSVVIADGSGTAPSGTILWNGPRIAGQNNSTTLAQANPNNPTNNQIIKSYVPLGNSQGNNVVDDGGGPRLKPGTSGASSIWNNWRVFWFDSFCGVPNGVTGSPTNSKNAGHCLTQEGFRIISAVSSNTNSWALPADAKKSVLRINAENITTLGTPALSSGAAPNFAYKNGGTTDANNSGLFLYGLNANLVLGSLYQPLIFDAKGGEFSIEVTRVPNDVNVYSKIYTRYDFDDGTGRPDNAVNYMGSTCNIYRCSGVNSSNATNISLGGSDYQTNSATHSSITIGSTIYDAAKNQLYAYKGIESYGVSFGALLDGTGLVSTGQRDYVQTFNEKRSGVDASYRYTCSGWFCSDSWQYEESVGSGWLINNRWFVNENVQGAGTPWVMGCSGTQTNCSTTNPPGSTNNATVNVVAPDGNTYTYRVLYPARNSGNRRSYRLDGTPSTSWTQPWEKTNTVNGNDKTTTFNQNTNYQILGLKTGCLNNCGAAGIGHTIPGIGQSGTTGFPTGLTSAQTVSNNLGSAVIDGLLIQHLKITTTGIN